MEYIITKTSREDFCVMHDERKLHLSTNHFKAYEKEADAIITHNIWLSTLKKYLLMMITNYVLFLC